LKIPKGNQNPNIEEEQTTRWPKEKAQKDKQRSTKHTHKTRILITLWYLQTLLLTKVLNICCSFGAVGNCFIQIPSLQESPIHPGRHSLCGHIPEFLSQNPL
jgi:hypothetical protein